MLLKWKIWLCAGLVGILMCAPVLSDKHALREDIIRLHVVAASDSQQDQAIKLSVRDAVLSLLQERMETLEDPEQAKQYLQQMLPQIKNTADNALAAAGVQDRAQVSLCREVFDIRHYDTFSLPSGVYESLRVTIGPGTGKNWWCVVFPSLCISATGAEFEEVAVGAGFSQELTDALEGKEEVEIRFFMLDLLGRVENIFFEGGF